MSQLFLKTKTAGYYMVQNANQLLYSQLFSNAAWTATNCTLTSGQTDPSAGTEAFTMTATNTNATLLQSIALTGSANRSFSLYIKRKTGTGAVSITVDGSTYVVETITGAWVRYSTPLLASGTVTAGIKLAVNTDEVYIAWAQLEDTNAVSPGYTTYVTNTANRYTVTQIADVDYPANTARGCAYLDEFFFVMDEATGDIYQSGRSTAATWASLDVIGTQIEPDSGVYLAKHNSYIMALKKWSCEFYYDAANTTGSILAPVASAAFKIGCASEDSVKEMAGTIVFMGQTRDGFGRAIFQLASETNVTMTGVNPTKISTPQVEKILNADSLATVYSWSANVGAHMLYGITLVTSGATMVYDFSTQEWSFFTYLSSSGGTKTITAISTAGVVTSAAHGFSDGDIVLVAGTNSSFNGWHVVTSPSSGSYSIQATGTAFSGSGTAQKYVETYFPVSSSTASGGKQYMQHATSGALYEFSQSVFVDAVGAIASRVRTPKFDGGTIDYKVMSSLEVIGDKVSSYAVLRHTDDDFASYSNFRRVNLSANRSNLARLGRFNRRAFEVLHVQNANLRLEALEIEVE